MTLSKWDKCSIEACERYYIGLNRACRKKTNKKKMRLVLTKHILEFYGPEGVTHYMLYREKIKK